MVIPVLISCTKEHLTEEPTRNQSYEFLIPKLKSWLEKQKANLSKTSIGRIDSLTANLNFGQIWLEKYKASKEFIVIPISVDFKSKNNSEKNTADHLVMVFEDDSITIGNIIQYNSVAGNNKLPKNTFTKIFTYQNLDCSGVFTVLSILDYFCFELNFENGKLKSVTDQIPRISTRVDSGRINGCTDWYLITTIYYTDGSSSSYEEYLFTSCSGDPECQNTRVSNGRSLRVNCGGGGNIEYEYDVVRPFTWDVAIVNNDYMHYRIQSTEEASGRKNANEPFGGHFTSIVHKISFELLGYGGWSWQELSNSVSVDNPSRVYAFTQGKAIKQAVQIHHENYTYRLFSQMGW